MVERNFKNRTLFHGDNLDFLRGINSGAIDLIATDPPFNKEIERRGRKGSDCEAAEYPDSWSWKENVHPSWLKLIKDDYPAINEVIEGACEAHSEDMGAFCCFLAVRLLEMHRVLKENGSIFVHCDPTASHYIKALLDAAFGEKNFINEISWCYEGAGRSKKCFSRKHDTILWYSKGQKFLYNSIRVPIPEHALPRYNQHDENGQYQIDGKGYKYYVKDGKNASDWWVGIPSLGSTSKKRVGYPTQKPVALYSRIIEAATEKSDWVLDPFIGSGTTGIAAEQLGRNWIGMDDWHEVERIIRDRIQKECSGLEGGEVYMTKEVPDRTDDGETAAATFVRPKRGKKSGRRMGRVEREQALEAMIATKGGCVCDGCGRRFEREYAEVDHDKPLHEGGTNDPSNLNLLCKVCNGVKRHWFTLTGLRREIQRIAKDQKDSLHRWAKASPFISGESSK